MMKGTFRIIWITVAAFPSTTSGLQTTPSSTTPATSTAVTSTTSRMLPQSAYDTILSGKIATIPNFISPALTASLRSDAKGLYDGGYFSADALAAYGTEVSHVVSQHKGLTFQINPLH